MSYFGIPDDFLESSIKDNVLFLFSIFHGFLVAFTVIPWWMWVVLVLATLFCVFAYFGDGRFRLVAIALTTIFVPWAIYNCFHLGSAMAAVQENFNVLADGCETPDPQAVYIVPTFYQGNAVVVPVDSKTNKVIGGFFVKDISDGKCLIKNMKVGRIISE